MSSVFVCFGAAERGDRWVEFLQILFQILWLRWGAMGGVLLDLVAARAQECCLKYFHVLWLRDGICGWRIRVSTSLRIPQWAFDRPRPPGVERSRTNRRLATG